MSGSELQNFLNLDLSKAVREEERDNWFYKASLEISDDSGNEYSLRYSASNICAVVPACDLWVNGKQHHFPDGTKEFDVLMAVLHGKR